MRAPRVHVALLISAVVPLTSALVVGCGSAGSDRDGSTASAPGDGRGAGKGAGHPSSDAKAASDSVDLYFTTGEQFQPVERPLPGPEGSPVPAVKALLGGPTDTESGSEAGAQSQIPDGTTLRALEISPSGKAVVRLSPRFTAGISGSAGARSPAERQELDARLGQVVYTLSEYDKVTSAKVVAGGVTLAPDLTRADFEKPAGGPPRIHKPRGARVSGTTGVQQRLAELGYLPENAIDGLYGYQTQQAVTAFQAWQGLDRDGVVGPVTSAALRTARRPKPGSGGPSRRIEVYRDKGVALLIKDRRVVRVIHVASGGPGTPTPPGAFTVSRKELQSWSVPFSTWLPYASYFNEGIAFHEYPDVPAYPASHGCVRVPAPEAKRVYAFARLGTTVIVI